MNLIEDVVGLQLLDNLKQVHDCNATSMLRLDKEIESLYTHSSQVGPFATLIRTPKYVENCSSKARISGAAFTESV